MLTRYDRQDIVGKNCRFLQTPHHLGPAKRGSKRSFTDDVSVNHLREKIAAKEDVQVSLVNYRKDGQSFINLLTVVPITMEDGGPVMYFFGLQVDLVEKPTAIGRQNEGMFSKSSMRCP